MKKEQAMAAANAAFDGFAFAEKISVDVGIFDALPVEETFDLCQQPGWSGESIYLHMAGKGHFGAEAKGFHELREDERIAFNFLHHTARFFGALVEPEPVPVADPLPADPARGFERVHDEDDDLTGRVGDDKEPWAISSGTKAELRGKIEAALGITATIQPEAKADAEAAAAAAAAEAEAKAEAEAAAEAEAKAKAEAELQRLKGEQTAKGVSKPAKPAA